MDKKEALNKALAELDKSFGKGTVLSGDTVVEVDRISTGSLSLDLITGGGLGKGRIIEIYGPESSGKTTLCIHIMAEAQKNGGNNLFIDAEHAFDSHYARNLGLDTSKLMIAQPDNGEQALEIAERLISSGSIDVCVIDSVAALVPKAEIEGEMGDNKIGLQARLMSQALRKLTGIVNKTKTVLIFTNQLREKIGVMFGNPETTTGGNALKFYASIRLDVRRISINKDSNGNIISNTVKIKTAKNKTAPPFQVCEVDIEYGLGISRAAEILKLAEAKGIVAKSGSWYSYNGTKLGQGADNVKILLNDNPELMEEILGKIKAEYGI